MTTDQFILKMSKQIQDIKEHDKPLALAVKSVMALQHQRIFRDGLNSRGSVIGTYKKKDIYISGDLAGDLGIKQIPKPFKGKTGKSKFKNGELHKSGYFESFLAYKKKIGKNNKIQTIDLFLSGNLQRNWANAELKQPPRAIKLSVHRYIVGLSQENAVKVSKKGTDLMRYGRVFNLSVVEKGKFLAVIQHELAKALR